MNRNSILAIFFGLGMFQQMYLPLVGKRNLTIQNIRNVLKKKMYNIYVDLEKKKDLLQVFINKNKLCVKINGKTKMSVSYDNIRKFDDLLILIQNILYFYLNSKSYIIILKQKDIFTSLKDFNNFKKIIYLKLNKKYKNIFMMVEEKELSFYRLDEEYINNSEHIEYFFKHRKSFYFTFLKLKYFLTDTLEGYGTSTINKEPFASIFKYKKNGTLQVILRKIESEEKISEINFRIFLKEVISYPYVKIKYRKLLYLAYEELEHMGSIEKYYLEMFISSLTKNKLVEYLKILNKTLHLNLTEEERCNFYKDYEVIGVEAGFLYKLKKCYKLTYAHERYTDFTHILYDFMGFFLGRNSQSVDVISKQIVYNLRILIDDILSNIYRDTKVNIYKVINNIDIYK